MEACGRAATTFDMPDRANESTDTMLRPDKAVNSVMVIDDRAITHKSTSGMRDLGTYEVKVCVLPSTRGTLRYYAVLSTLFFTKKIRYRTYQSVGTYRV